MARRLSSAVLALSVLLQVPMGFDRAFQGCNFVQIQPLWLMGGGHVGVVRDMIQTTQYLGFEGSGVLIVSC